MDYLFFLTIFAFMTSPLGFWVTLPLTGLAILSLTTYVITRREPKPRRGSADPVGSISRLKTIITDFMAAAAQFKESRKGKNSVANLEGFHKPEDHAFYNESYYFNGCDLETKDRFITRISRRSNFGSKSYVFLLIDSKEHGMLSLEADVDVGREYTTKSPSCLGLTYDCISPMKKWRLKYSGQMMKGCVHPRDHAKRSEAQRIHVDLDLIYEAESPLFWYMRDDHPECLAKNLAQESWGLDFLKVCLKRTVDHAHYEDFGRAKGTICVNYDKQSPKYDFGTFRDHSWDIRRWATMDNLNILLIALEQPLFLNQSAEQDEYWYLDLTLVDMPGNVGGVERYSTGYVLGNKPTTAKLAVTKATSILDIGFEEGPEGFPGGPKERYPLPTQEVTMSVALHPRDVKFGRKAPTPRVVRVTMSGETRRLLYWPDQGAFKVYEDYLDFEIEDVLTQRKVKGYGTRQSGFCVGDFDPSLGGCG